MDNKSWGTEQVEALDLSKPNVHCGMSTEEVGLTANISESIANSEFGLGDQLCDVAEASNDGPTQNEPLDLRGKEESATVDPYGYLQREEFTSEIYKVEICNLPKHFGFQQLKKRLVTSLGLNPHKVKIIPRTNFAFVTFRSEDDREKALQKISGHVWKGAVLQAKKASPAADPFLKKRKQQEDRAGESADKKQKVETEDDNLSPGIKLKNSVTPLWNVPYEEQLARKRQGIVDVLKSVASRSDIKEFFFKQRKEYYGMCCELLPIKPSPVLEGYRNKCEFSVGKNMEGNDSVGFRFGLYKDGNKCVGEPDELVIIPEAMKKVVKCFQQYLTVSIYPVFDPEYHTGHWHQLTVRTTRGNEVMAIAEFHPQQLTKDYLEKEKSRLKEFFTDGPGKTAEITSLYFHQSRARATRDDEIEPYEHIFGETHIYEELHGMKFRVSPDAFFQVNTAAAEVLLTQIADWCEITPNTTILDICCGTGIIGLSLANRVAKVIGVEMCQQAIEDAKANAKLNGVTNVEYHCGKAEDVMPSIMKNIWTADVVAIVDPPRAGLHKKVIKTLRSCLRLKRLVYVSCNPRGAQHNYFDLIRKESKKHRGDSYFPVKAVPVDLFPQTNHCELVMLFERNHEEIGESVKFQGDCSDSADNSASNACSEKDAADNELCIPIDEEKLEAEMQDQSQSVVMDLSSSSKPLETSNETCVNS